MIAKVFYWVYSAFRISFSYEEEEGMKDCVVSSLLRPYVVPLVFNFSP